MTHDQFTIKNYGRYLEFADPTNKYQCIDLMRYYIRDVWGMDPYAIPTAKYAKDIYTKFESTPTLRKIPNTPNNVPSKGDILFMGWWWPITGIPGHVGIVESADVYKFVLFNQNYPTGSACNFRQFKYKYGGMPYWMSIVRGWIHKV